MTTSSFTAWTASVLLVSVRIAMLFIATHPFAGIPVPAIARVILILALAAGMVGASNTLVFDLDLISLVSLVIHESVVGAAIAAGLFSAFASFQFAGRLLDFQIGFGIASLVDLATRNNAPLLGTALSMLAAVFLFAIDGHLALLRLLKLSITKLPPGTGIAELQLDVLVAQFATCFSFGMILVAPVVLCLFLIDIGMAFMSRTMPQMNVFVMSLALKALVGMTVLAISIPFAGNTIHRVFDSMFDTWSRMLA